MNKSCCRTTKLFEVLSQPQPFDDTLQFNCKTCYIRHQILLRIMSLILSSNLYHSDPKVLDRQDWANRRTGLGKQTDRTRQTNGQDWANRLTGLGKQTDRTGQTGLGNRRTGLGKQTDRTGQTDGQDWATRERLHCLPSPVCIFWMHFVTMTPTHWQQQGL